MMPLTTQRVLSALTVAGSTIAGGAFGYLAQHAPSTFDVADWKPVLIGAVGAGLVALSHLYQSPPTKPIPDTQPVDTQTADTKPVRPFPKPIPEADRKEP